MKKNVWRLLPIKFDSREFHSNANHLRRTFQKFHDKIERIVKPSTLVEYSEGTFPECRNIENNLRE